MIQHIPGVRIVRTGLLFAVWCLATPPAAQADRTWTWTGHGARPDWMDAHNWSCTGEGCPVPELHPDDSGADVVITNTRRAPEIGGKGVGGAFGVRSLTLKAGATLTIRSAGDELPGGRTGLRVWGGGVRLESGATIRLDGGFLDLRGGGVLDIAPGAMIEFIRSDAQLRFTDDDREGEPAPPEILVEGATEAERSSARGMIQGARFVTTVPVQAVGGANDSLLKIHRIDGRFRVDAHLINNGEVIIDTADTQLTLCGRPKMGPGRWRVGTTEQGAERGTIVVDAIVVGDSCSLLDVLYGTIDVNTFWPSGGKLHMDGERTPGTRVEVAAGKIMQFGHRVYCPCAGQ